MKQIQAQFGRRASAVPNLIQELSLLTWNCCVRWWSISIRLSCLRVLVSTLQYF